MGLLCSIPCLRSFLQSRAAWALLSNPHAGITDDDDDDSSLNCSYLCHAYSTDMILGSAFEADLEAEQTQLKEERSKIEALTKAEKWA